MDLITVVGIAVGLAMDAFAVSIASGFVVQSLRIGLALRMACAFGLFQMLMPVTGWLAGLTIKNHITSYDHWVAFGLLVFIGGKMIYESLSLDKKQARSDPFKISALFLLSVATSIDALAVGVTFAFLESSIFFPVACIGGITFALSLAGVYIGRRVGHLFESKIEFLGGVVLILIGLKILLEHLWGT